MQGSAFSTKTGVENYIYCKAAFPLLEWSLIINFCRKPWANRGYCETKMSNDKIELYDKKNCILLFVWAAQCTHCAIPCVRVSELYFTLNTDFLTSSKTCCDLNRCQVRSIWRHSIIPICYISRSEHKQNIPTTKQQARNNNLKKETNQYIKYLKTHLFPWFSPQ